MKRFVLLFLSFAVAAFVLPAFSAAGASAPTTEGAIGAALQAGVSAEPAGAHSSRSRRWKRPKKMTFAKARQQAFRSAQRIYLSPEFTFDDFGVLRCDRRSRTKVRCYTWVSEDYYDEDGYYDDTLACDWWTTSYWRRNGRLGVWESSPDCFWLSEV